MTYFTHFVNIVNAFQEHGEIAPQELKILLRVERSRNRFTFEDFWAASHVLGFGKDGPLGVEFKDDTEDEFIVNAWRNMVHKVWQVPYAGPTMVRDVHEAFRVLAEGRGSIRLRQLWESDNAKMLTTKDAYAMLGIPENADESMLWAAFSLRVR